MLETIARIKELKQKILIELKSSKEKIDSFKKSRSTVKSLYISN